MRNSSRSLSVIFPFSSSQPSFFRELNTVSGVSGPRIYAYAAHDTTRSPAPMASVPLRGNFVAMVVSDFVTAGDEIGVFASARILRDPRIIYHPDFAISPI